MGGKIMFEIVLKEELAPKIKLFKVLAPELARKAQPGQFIILRIDEEGERIPLTIADFDREAGTITIIFQEVDKTTELLGTLEKGDFLKDFVGPLGMESEIENYGTVVCIGGGVGVAPVFPIARALKEAGNTVISIIGARTAEMLIWKQEMAAISSRLHVATDDGSAGQKGFVSDVLVDILGQTSVDRIIAIGPVPMMEAVCKVAPESITTMVSLNPIMVDGTGMCGACRVEVDNKTRFACVDGPEFDGHKVNWELVKMRAKMFAKEEKEALSYHRCGEGECQCHRTSQNAK
jgi:ferredoxin--NADP+ reductase